MAPLDALTSPRARQATASGATILAGRYELLRGIGSGGMGVVWAARDQVLGRKVAIKLLRSDLAKDVRARRRFCREMLALATIRGMNVPTVYDVGQDDEGQLFASMELLNGVNLAQLLEENGPVDTGRAVGLVLQACDGIAQAHAAGILHRDVKPGNLIVCRGRRGEELVKVLDFGIAGRVDDFSTSHSNAGGVLGTLRYLAPEQAQSSHLADERSDMYSLGVVLYQLLSGKLPHDGESAPEILRHLLYEPAVPIARHLPELSPALVAVIERATAHDPDRRYATVEELADALAAVELGGESGMHPAPVLAAASARGSWRSVAAGIALVTLGVAGGVLIGWKQAVRTITAQVQPLAPAEILSAGTEPVLPTASATAVASPPRESPAAPPSARASESARSSASRSTPRTPTTPRAAPQFELRNPYRSSSFPSN